MEFFLIFKIQIFKIMIRKEEKDSQRESAVELVVGKRKRAEKEEDEEDEEDEEEEEEKEEFSTYMNQLSKII